MKRKSLTVTVLSPFSVLVVFQGARLQRLRVPVSDQGAGHGGHGGAGIVARHGALDERAGGGAAAGGAHLTAPTAEAGGQRPSHRLGGQQPAHQPHQSHVQSAQVKKNAPDQTTRQK